MLLEAWRAAERALPAGVGDVRAVEEMMPRKIKKKRMLTADDGAELGWEECVAHARARARARATVSSFSLSFSPVGHARDNPPPRALDQAIIGRGEAERGGETRSPCAHRLRPRLSRALPTRMYLTALPIVTATAALLLSSSRVVAWSRQVLRASCLRSRENKRFARLFCENTKVRPVFLQVLRLPIP